MGLLDGLLGNASEINTDKVAADLQPLMIPGEQIEKAFKLIRDMYVFTNKRLFIIDKQGVTGSKVEYLSVPYGSIKKFSKENAGTLDLDAEIKIWVTGDALPIKMEFRKDTQNMDEIYRLLSQHVL